MLHAAHHAASMPLGFDNPHTFTPPPSVSAYTGRKTWRAPPP